MSRNLRHRSKAIPAIPLKQSAKSRSSTFNDSSDDDYEGVNAISDSEDDDEPDVEEAEEQDIIREEEDDIPTPRPTPAFWEGNWSDFDVLEDNNPLYEVAPESTLSDGETRRVRFDLSDSSSTISNDEDYDAEYPFPDPFVPQADLDPKFRRQIEEDPEDDITSLDGGYWDLNAANSQSLDEYSESELDIGNDTSSGDSETDESGYDTDEGETTEEDLPEQRFVPVRSVLRHASLDESSEEEIITRRAIPRTPRAGDKNGPRAGNFIHRTAQPLAMLDLKTKRLLMYHANFRRHSFDAPRQSPKERFGDIFEELSPMISNSANLMMSAMCNADNTWGQGQFLEGEILGGQVLGPPEAFFPFRSISANGEISENEHSFIDEDDIDELFTLEDLIDFPEEDVRDAYDEVGEDSTTDGDPFLTPRPITAASDDQPLILSNPHLVGAFRSNQATHRLLSSRNATVDSLRFSSRFNTTAIQGIKSGHLDAATTPITPLRKQKPRPMDSSPLAAQQNKRKFSGEVRGHKRAKSMPFA